MESCSSSTTQTGRSSWKSHLTRRNGILLGLIALLGIGLAFGGGWGWLVAIGVAPVILSLLPCVVLCGLGLCMMGMGNKKTATPPMIAPQNDATAQTMQGISQPALRQPDIAPQNS
jgi:hypothetical protein